MRENEGIKMRIKFTKNHPDAVMPMTAKEFYARNQEAFFCKTLFSGLEMRSMVLEWIRSGDFTASDLRKHLDGPHTDMWRNVACFMPLLEKLENDHENI